MDKLKFQAALLNVKFDRSYKNVLRFENREAQEEYFKLSSLFLTAQPINFNAGSLLETFIFYNKKESENLNDLLSKNYCIIKDNSENASLKYYYYFIRDAIQDSATQIKLRLELDIFQTYYIDLNFSDCRIERAHLNRFIDVGNNRVIFDGTTKSKLFEREPIQNVSKRLTKRTKLNLYGSLLNDVAIKWLNENILCWAYVYLDPNHSYKRANPKDDEGIQIEQCKIYGFGGASTELLDKKSGVFETNFSILCYPIYKNPTSKIKVKCYAYGTGEEKTLDLTSDITDFKKVNEGAAFIYAIKLSKCSPFQSFAGGAMAASIDEESNTLTITEGTKGQLRENFGVSIFDYSNSTLSPSTGYIVMLNQSDHIYSEEYKTKLKYFTKSEIISSKKDAKFNPKLYGIDFYELKLTDETAQGFSIDLQKLNDDSISIEYREPLTPDITRGYITIDFVNKDGYSGDRVYIPECKENFTGAITINDNSLTLVTSAFQNMLASNKNYFLQNTVNRFLGLGEGLVNSGMNALRGNQFSAISSLVGAGVGFGASIINQQLAVDNMKNSPSDIQNAKGNAILNGMTTDFGVFIEEYEILDNEKEIINDYLCEFGFAVNLIGNIKEFDNIRKHYNYVKAQIEETSGVNISNNVHDKFVNAFKDGVRFWNIDNFSYEQENYERWLEDGAN